MASLVRSFFKVILSSTLRQGKLILFEEKMNRTWKKMMVPDDPRVVGSMNTTDSFVALSKWKKGFCFDF
ncbi:hypothetical protein LIER_40255 [Lithospermum erythrorhizon]|uniref:Uncharacterized protein n=1 Tax=Lithospermum erythrorhizon TaxID=34254 RepID=A0AAV3QVY0_LITER